VNARPLGQKLPTHYTHNADGLSSRGDVCSCTRKSSNRVPTCRLGTAWACLSSRSYPQERFSRAIRTTKSSTSLSTRGRLSDVRGGVCRPHCEGPDGPLRGSSSLNGYNEVVQASRRRVQMPSMGLQHACSRMYREINSLQKLNMNYSMIAFMKASEASA
jgi:hypothetical protein